MIPLLIKHWDKILKKYKQNSSVILNYYQKDLEMKLFMTFNPHIENYSMKKLLNDFRYALQKYYQKELGRKYKFFVFDKFFHLNNPSRSRKILPFRLSTMIFCQLFLVIIHRQKSKVIKLNYYLSFQTIMFNKKIGV